MLRRVGRAIGADKRVLGNTPDKGGEGALVRCNDVFERNGEEGREVP